MFAALLHSTSARVFCSALILCLLLLLAVARTVQSSNDIVYVYDELGRLVAVIDTAGETAVYSYDAVGNLLSINRYSSSVVSIIQFTPARGAVGTPVTIYGTAFSPTASQNTVTFNGVAATVISATPTRITTTVPAGATTGPIAVTAPGGNATSTVSFIVGETGAPTITDFTPTIGTAGTSVTITGTNYETAPQNNKAKFNTTYSSITAATSTTITTSVPASSSSGRISVSTPAGTAVSSADFFIPPAPYSVADIAVTGRMAIGESKVVTIPANKVGLILFDGTAGQRVSLGMNGVTIGGSNGVATVAIYKTTGTVLLAPFEFSATGQGTPSQVLPATGTYSIVVDPYNANTGSVTLHLSEDLSPPISINGDPVNLTFRPGQNAWLRFTGTAGQRVSAAVNGVTITGQWGRGVIALYKPDGTVLHPNLEFDTTGHGTASKGLPVTGTYAILIDPYYANSGNVTVYLSEDLAPPISINDPPVNLTFRPGQNAWLPFAGTAGQRVNVGISGVSVSGQWGRGVVALYNPDGTVLHSNLEFDPTGQGTGSKTLPVTGTYAILVDLYYANSGNLTVTLSADVTGTIAMNGSPVTLQLRSGQNGWLTFDGTAGQRVSAGINGVTLNGQWGRGVIAIYKPDGTVLHPNLEFDTPGHGTASKVLPVTGTYAILVDPYYANSGNVTVYLSEDVAPPISINDPPVNLTFRPGQNAWLPFAGTAGQRVSVGISGVSVSGQWGRGVVALYNPDGTVLHPNLEFDTAGHGTASKVLPVTGTYAILVDLYNANSGSLTVTLSADVTGTITMNGSPVTMELRAGQNGWLTFNGTAGHRVSAGINGVTLSGQWGRGVIAIYKPDGTVLHPNLEFDTPGHGTASKVLPVTGTYAILVDPYNANYGNVTVYLSEDLAPPITINGSAVDLTFRPGQNAWLPFSGTAGQRVSVGINGVSVTGQWGRGVVALYNPDGTVLHSNLEFDTPGHGTASKVLPVTGNYAILVDLYNANSGSLTVTLSEDLGPPITINDVPVNLTFRPGQNAWLTFAGTAGQRVSVGISGVSVTGQWGRGVVALYKPDGTVLHSNLEFDTPGHGTASKVLPVTGTYAVLVDLYNANSGSLTVTLSADLGPPITINGDPVNLTFRPGQNAWLTFAGTAGQRVSVGISGVSVTGQWGRGVVALYNPDGTVLHPNLEFDTAGHGTASKVLAVTGNYAILVDLYNANSGSLTVTLSEDLAPAISIGGPPVTLSFTRVGQNGRLTFSGNSGQVITVVVSNNTIGTTTVTLLKPDGTTLTSTSTSNANFNLASSTLPSTGTYSVNVDPAGAGTGNITLQLYDPSTNVATLKADYRFENDRDSSVSGAPTLTDLGTNSFTTATVDGVSKSVLSFTQNNGLSLSSTSGLVSSTSYSIVMLFSFQQTSGWRRVSDVRNATTDGGLYINGQLNFYPHASGPTAIAANSYVQVVLTRDPIGTVTGYVNGTQQFQFTDSNSYALISSSNTIRFFRDDANAGEASPGSVARIRLYDGVLTPTQVAALDRLP